MNISWRRLLLIGIGIVVHGTLLAAGDTVVKRQGWDYDRAGFQEPANEIEQLRQEPHLKVTGWAEYDFEMPEAGWYELWIADVPPEWNRDVYLDGELMIRRGFSNRDTDVDKDAVRGEANVKEMNLFLNKGKHTLRYQRFSGPGRLPNLWELRPAVGRPEASIRVRIEGSPIVEPGDAVTFSVWGGSPEATSYALFLEDQLTEELTPLGTIAFPAISEPIEKSLVLAVEKPGLYSVVGRSGDVELGEADLKVGYLLVAEADAPRPAPKATRLQVAEFFKSGAILQRDKPLPIWGWAQPDKSVTVQLADQKQEAFADKDGRWQVAFEPMSAGGPYELVVATEGETIRSTDIWLGEVWVLSGQSNMGGPLLKCTGGKEAAKKANFPTVRMARVIEAETASGEQRPHVYWFNADSGGDPQRLNRWLGIHFAFGRDLYEALGVPVGLIAVNRGGTQIASWSSEELLRSEPSLSAMTEGWQQQESEYVPQIVWIQKLAAQIHQWHENGEPAGKVPELKVKVDTRNKPSGNYKALIEPLAPMALRGILWYQGESDSQMAVAYRQRFPALIDSWRELWGDPALPFIYAQIAYGNGAPYDGQPGEDAGSELKEAQLLTLEVPNTAMIVTNDLMTPKDNVHYHDKLTVGDRFAKAALATVYGKDIVSSGPVYTHMNKEGQSLRLYFDNAEGGLSAKDGKPGGFAVAGEDRNWVWADASIDGDTVLVSSPEVPDPVAARYSWTKQPSGGNLYNQAGLPAPVFRTDEWPLSTEGVEWFSQD